MANRVELAGVATWYDERGAGDPLVLLHGALADATSFGATEPALRPGFHVFLPERRGHGHTPDVEGPITYELMAADTVAFLETVVGGPAHLLGHSDGAIVALLVALRRPDLVRRLVLISSNFHHDGVLPDVFDVGAIPPPLVDAYARISPDGRDHFPVVVGKIARMIATEPTLTPADLGGVRARTLVMAGDDDMVRAEHTLALYRGIPEAELAIVPGTSHTLIFEKPELCNRLILDFLTTDPRPTLMPVRRQIRP